MACPGLRCEDDHLQTPAHDPPNKRLAERVTWDENETHEINDGSSPDKCC